MTRSRPSWATRCSTPPPAGARLRPSTHPPPARRQPDPRSPGPARLPGRAHPAAAAVGQRRPVPRGGHFLAARFGVARVRAPALWAYGTLEAEGRLTRTTTLSGGTTARSRHLPRRPAAGLLPHPQPAPARADRAAAHPGARLRGQVFLVRTSRYAPPPPPQPRCATCLAPHIRLAGGRADALPGAGPGDAWLPRVAAEVGYEGRRLSLGLGPGRDVVGAAGYAEAVWADFATSRGRGGSARSGARWSPRASTATAGRPARRRTPPGVNGTGAVEWRFARGFVASAALRAPLPVRGGGGAGPVAGHREPPAGWRIPAAGGP
jgi:hypothetical protein